ncbi:PAXIP1-associated glutamate-rich protein 1-like [Uloborus diversus]|uniref:PAXIP1-associated glutamate-rich protein 1-like n=1 Tax=Uloborus diversus TaxID=327109 RepID=UPI00240A4634|nr:PAXIP1-associated glutamate-rich protein 1-like [Uloborus diversus]
MENISSGTENDWVINCSDDEFSSSAKGREGIWEPTPEEIINMYDILDSKGVMDFEWQCPGRRSPSVNSNKSDMNDKGSISDDEANKKIEPNEFDFDDEFGIEQTPKICPRKRVTQPTSAQRRVARLDKVMFDIQRHRKLDELELQKDLAEANASSPKVGTTMENKT